MVEKIKNLFVITLDDGRQTQRYASFDDMTRAALGVALVVWCGGVAAVTATPRLCRYSARDLLQPSRLALSFMVLKDTPRAAASVRRRSRRQCRP